MHQLDRPLLQREITDNSHLLHYKSKFQDMTKLAPGLLLLLLTTNVQAQRAAPKKEIHVPLQADHWECPPNIAEFLTYKSVPALKITGKGTVVLKDLDFKDGTIEFDLDPADEKSFASIYFRWENDKENEIFYFRSARAGNFDAVDAIQYAPVIKGVNLWDMMYHYQRNANYTIGQWNHVKMVVSGQQMKVYINGNEHAVLEVPQLEGNTTHGRLAFEGKLTVSNLVVKPDQTEGLSPLPGTDITDNDARYLRKWQISPLATLPDKIDFNYELMPDKNTKWDTIRAERRGLINITRIYGGAAVGPHRVTFLKTTIHSNTDQKKLLHLGFSDEVWVFINGKPVYVDKNLYGAPLMKEPDGRISVDNCSFSLPLVKGDNELLIAVENNFYGWGIIAQFDDLKDLSIER